MLYSDIDKAMTTVFRKIRYEEINQEQEDEIRELLMMSYGRSKLGNEVCYRPFWVAAKILQQDLDSQAISESNKTVFTGYVTPIQSLLDLQASFDKSNGLIIPPGFEAVKVEEDSSGVGVMSIFTI